MGDELHKLYLLEFLVHSVQYKSVIQLDEDFLQTLGPTCIYFNAEYLPSLTVTEIDFCQRDWFSNKTVKLKSGKSCLFSTGNQRVKASKLKTDITIKRLLPEGSKPNHYCMGKASLSLRDKFVNVLNSKGSMPESECTKMCLDFKNTLGEVVGDIKFILRLTCFGTVIVTEFQKNIDDSQAFLFKGDRILSAADDSISARKNNQCPSYSGKAQMPNPNFMNRQMNNCQNQNVNPHSLPMGMNQVYNLQGPPPNRFSQQQYPGKCPINQTAMQQYRGSPNQGFIPPAMNTQAFNVPTVPPPFNNTQMPPGFPTPKQQYCS